MVNISIVDAGAVTRTHHGEVIHIMYQYVYIGTGKTIYSCVQMEMYHNDVNNKSLKVPGENNVSLLLVATVLLLVSHLICHTWTCNLTLMQN